MVLIAGLTGTRNLTNATASGRELKLNDENTLNLAIQSVGLVVGFSSVTRVCLDDSCSQFHESFNTFSNINGTAQRVYNAESLYTRIATGAEFEQGVLADYESNNIPVDQRITPVADICLLGLCLTKEQWCQYDPSCSVSPYQEPAAHVKGGVIAGFVVLGVILLVAGLYLVHRHLQAQQAKRYRSVFAGRIADTIQVRSSMRSLTADTLADEFNKIDSGVKDGKISKEELWDFVSSGKAGEMEKHDFDALFAAIDLDKNGSVDFLEFCAFMGKCEKEYKLARVDRRAQLVANASSRRLLDTENSEDGAMDNKEY
eukprot:CAMPEP_0116557396 /NCGR_PEP_ID=MMETSP0397-20121206/9217_1 /TAXON_ID=216820 /ORGANISM="Cyclophora tenuis, Strain ECT3854" /LENGTH=314 /DNA_ID=CAMNT_0004082849 /DNA_START=1 /DNA_END=946 /DNA_ORIENTATION=-